VLDEDDDDVDGIGEGFRILGSADGIAGADEIEQSHKPEDGGAFKSVKRSWRSPRTSSP